MPDAAVAATRTRHLERPTSLAGIIEAMKGLALVAVAALALAGCSHDIGDLDDADSPIARYDWDSSAAMEALLEGKLELRNGCLVVNLSYDPYLPVVAIFPRAYTAWDAEASVLTYSGHEYRMGDAVSAGGGGAEAIPNEGFPAACEPFVTDNTGVFYIQDTDLKPFLEEGD